MAKFDRSQLRATSLNVLNQQEKEVKEKTQNKNTNDRPGFLDIPEGKTATKFRLFPSHPEYNTYLFPKVVTWLPQEVWVDKDNKVVKNPEDVSKLKKEIKNFPIFDAKVHGGYEKDIIEEYRNFYVKLVFGRFPDKETRKKKLFVLRDFDGKTSIQPKTSYLCYAYQYTKEGKKFGRLEMPVTLRNALSALSITEEVDEPIQLDPFTDPDTGKAVLVIYRQKDDSGEKLQPAQMYTASLEWKGNYALTDEEIEFFVAQEPIGKSLVKAYKRNDFERALAGLKIYDEKHKLGVFAHEEWLDICEEISNMIPDDPEEEKKEEAKAQPIKDKKTQKIEGSIAIQTTKSSSKITTQVKSKISDEFSELTRKELKEFISDQELPILVKPNMTDEDIRNEIRKCRDSEVQEQDEITNESKEEYLQDEVEEPTNELPWDQEEKEADKAIQQAPKVKISDRLSQFQKQLQANKKSNS